MKGPGKNPFPNVLDDVTPRTTAMLKKAKPQQINFPIEPELKKLLDRVIHHKGKKTNQKKWLTELIEKAVKADPDSLKPVPGEDE